MDSRLALIDLNIQLVVAQYGQPDNVEHLFELLTSEFPEDLITMDEVLLWNSMSWEIADLERSLEHEYERFEYFDER